MTQEEKELLLKDLCARLPYGVKIAKRQYNYCNSLTLTGIVGDRCYFNDNPRYDGDCPIDEIKPYLLPISSMTEEEQRTLDSMCNGVEMVSRLSGLKMFTKHLIGSMKIISTIEALLKRDLLLMQHD